VTRVERRYRLFRREPYSVDQALKIRAGARVSATSAA